LTNIFTSGLIQSHHPPESELTLLANFSRKYSVFLGAWRTSGPS
jgi:hypothetical protein